MDNKFLYSEAPDESWHKLHETIVSPFVLEQIMAVYKEHGIELYAYNLGRRKAVKKYDSLQIWLYYKKAEQYREKV